MKEFMENKKWVIPLGIVTALLIIIMFNLKKIYEFGIVFGLIFASISLELSDSAWIYTRNDSIENIFDEMMANDCKGLREETYIRRGENDRSGLWISLYYEELSKGMEASVGSTINHDLGNTLGGRREIEIELSLEKSDRLFKYSIYYDQILNTIMVPRWIRIDANTATNWNNAEEMYYIIQNEILIGKWLETQKSRFTRDDLGEFKIISDIPYEYTGLPDSKPIENIIEKEREEKVTYLVWLDNDRLLCVQRNDLFQTLDKERSENCSLEGLLILNNDFYDWLKTSGQATGNLERVPESMEKGMENTQLMLQNCPIEEMEKMLPTCEFYLEPGYLHIRFPYWNWESDKPGWERNGDELWRRWLNIKTEDIEEFLKVEKW